MRRRPQIQPELPDAPAPDLGPYRGLDDAQVFAMRKAATCPALELEIQNRRRFEAQWAEPWQSGPDSEVPPPIKAGYRQFL